MVGFCSCQPQMFTIGLSLTAGADTRGHKFSLFHFHQQCWSTNEHNQSNKGRLSPAGLSETQDVHTRIEILNN